MNDKVTVPDAAKRLGISEGAIRQRIHRGTLHADKDESGRVYVTLTPEDTQNIHINTDVKAHDYDSDNSLVDELRDRIRFLEQDLADRKEENRRKDHIIMALTNRIPELEAPADVTESSQRPVNEESRGGDVPPDAPKASWWRRLF